MGDWITTFTNEQETDILSYLVGARATMPFVGPEEEPEVQSVQQFVDAAIAMAMLSVSAWVASHPET